jgi:hypothetical protein
MRLSLFSVYPAAMVTSVVLISGCGLTDSGRAQSTTKAFHLAVQSGDDTATDALLTTKARETLQRFRGLNSNLAKNSPGELTVGTAVIEGDLAHVPTITKNSDNKTTETETLLRREDGNWRVYGLKMTNTDGKSLTIDFEHPEAMVGELLGQLAGEFAKGLSGLAKGFSESSPDAEKAGRALGEMLNSFSKGMADGMKEGEKK